MSRDDASSKSKGALERDESEEAANVENVVDGDQAAEEVEEVPAQESSREPV